MVDEYFEEVLILSLDVKNDYWVLDLGNYFHITSNKDYFIECIQGDFWQVNLGDDEPCIIVGMVKVNVKPPNINWCLVKKVTYIPYLKRNNISNNNLYGDGYVVLFINKT